MIYYGKCELIIQLRKRLVWGKEMGCYNLQGIYLHASHSEENSRL